MANPHAVGIAKTTRKRRPPRTTAGAGCIILGSIGQYAQLLPNLHFVLFFRCKTENKSFVLLSLRR
jgi:hypothetical protein